MPLNTEESADRKLVEDLIVAWQEAASNGDSRSPERFLDDHPDVCARPDLRAEVLLALADISCFERQASVRPNLPQLPGYEILGLIGAGGMGVVYRARDIELDRQVAVKLLHGGQWADHVRRRRFAIEGKVVAQLEHENIVRLYHVGESDGTPYLIVEYASGGNLDQHWGNSPQNPLQVARMVEIIARAIHYTHRHSKRIIHRDLKPTNVLLSASGEPKVADFGLAKMLDGDADLSRTGECLGTAHYMAPEQLEGRADERTDVYALGAIIYRGLTGRTPFLAGSITDVYRQVATETPVSPRKLVAGVDRDIETICLKCLEKSPEKRYASADELARDLSRYLDRLPIRARHAGWLERTWRAIRANPQIAATLAALLVAAAVASWGYWRAERSHREAVSAIESLLDSLDAKAEIVRHDESLKQDDLHAFRMALLKAVLAQYRTLLTDGSPSTVDPVRLARALQKVGGIEHDLGDVASARAAYLDAANAWRELAATKSPPDEFTDSQVDSLCCAAEVEISLQLTDDAESHARQALALAASRVANSPRSLSALARLAHCYQTLGHVDFGRGRYREALRFQQQSLGLRTQVAEREPTAENRFELADAYRAIGLSRHKVAESSNTQIRSDFDRALQEVRAALRDEPHQIKFRQLEGRILSNRGMSDRRPSVPESDPRWPSANELALRNSEKTLVEAVAVRRKLADDYPAYARHQLGLAAVIGNLADTYTGLNELGIDERQDEYAARSEAVAIYEKLYARRPEVHEHELGLVLHSLRLARVLHELGRDADSVRIFKSLIDRRIPIGSLERNARDWCTHALCWTLVEADSSSSSDGRTGNFVQVMECLKQARDCHLAQITPTMAFVKNDLVFARYRDQFEFQQFLAELESERQNWLRETNSPAVDNTRDSP